MVGAICHGAIALGKYPKQDSRLRETNSCSPGSEAASSFPTIRRPYLNDRGGLHEHEAVCSQSGHRWQADHWSGPIACIGVLDRNAAFDGRRQSGFSFIAVATIAKEEWACCSM